MEEFISYFILFWFRNENLFWFFLDGFTPVSFFLAYFVELLFYTPLWKCWGFFIYYFINSTQVKRWSWKLKFWCHQKSMLLPPILVHLSLFLQHVLGEKTVQFFFLSQLPWTCAHLIQGGCEDVVGGSCCLLL